MVVAIILVSLLSYICAFYGLLLTNIKYINYKLTTKKSVIKKIYYYKILN